MRYPGARWSESPNRSPREGAKVEVVVIHHISLPPGEFGTGFIEEFFRNRLDGAAHPYFAAIAGMRVSAHFLILRGGEVVQFVDTDEAAWHAGVSSWKGREGVNRFSVGIELEGDGETTYEEAQYEALTSLLTWLREVHPGIAVENVVGHEEVSPGRKTDPGPTFDWSRIQAPGNNRRSTFS